MATLMPFVERRSRVRLSEMPLRRRYRTPREADRRRMPPGGFDIAGTLELNLDKFLTAVKRGRERLHERSQETVVAGIGPEPIEPEEPAEFDRFGG